jgi:bifunctional DNA-binding transcriptional regulator/antitoxin component of YhaV-PrlF toxin-antitoxin module
MDNPTYAHMTNKKDAAKAQETQADRKSFLMQSVTTHDNGRMTIPRRFREMYQLEEDDILDIMFDGGDCSFWGLDVRMDGSHRIRVPRIKRDLYDLDDGDIVDVQVYVTGLSL